jgi:hypothetical protein
METQQGLPSTVLTIESHPVQQQEQLPVASAPATSTWISDRQARIFQAQIESDVLLQLTRQRQGLSSAISANEINMHQQQLLLLLLQLSAAPAPDDLLQLMRQRQAFFNTISVSESNIQQLLPQLTVAHSLNASASNSSPFSHEMMLQGLGGPDLLQLLLLRVQAQQGLASAAPVTASNSSSLSQKHILHGLSRERGFLHNTMQHILSQQGLSSLAAATESANHQQHQQQQHQQHQDFASTIVWSLNNVRNLMTSPRQSKSESSIRGDREGAPAAASTPPSFSCSGITMGLPDDNRRLSEYQIVIRQHLEIFEAKQEDVRSNIQGRKRRLFLGQVGIRCRHCSNLRLRQRGRTAVYYPLKLIGLYQAAQHMARSHLSDSCSQIHPGIKQRLRDLRLRRETASGGKEYWAEAGRAIGLYETEDGLRLHPGAAP